MKVKDLGHVLLRIFVIYLFILSWKSLVQAFSLLGIYFTQDYATSDIGTLTISSVITSFLTFAVYLQVAIYIYIKPHKIIDRALSYREVDESETTAQSAITKEDLMAIGLVLVGIYILSGAIPSLFSEISTMIRYKTGIPPLNFDHFDPKTWLFIIDIIGKVIYLFLGLLLIFGPSGLRKLFTKTAKDISNSIKKIRRD